MAGIYLHIPFCKQKCHYCDFFSTTRLSKSNDFVEAICTELVQKSSHLNGEMVNTIYFGGGTPSVLSHSQLMQIFETINSHYQIASDPEITLEANPDDLTTAYFADLKHTPINRLSIGIQSFIDEDLKLMNRRHNGHQAFASVLDAQKYGFNNISIDLIYGLPHSNADKWQSNLEKASKLNVQHISAYHLTFEPKTVFTNRLNKKQLLIPTEDESLQQFEGLILWASQNGFQHYEISNFAKPNYYSRHNRAYWQQQKYLGVGPSAHSYNMLERSWNVSNLDEYIHNTLHQIPCSQHETLSKTNVINELIMTNLRTMWGINLNQFKHQFGELPLNTLQKKAEAFLKNNWLIIDGHSIKLTQQGMFVSDSILTDLLFDE